MKKIKRVLLVDDDTISSWLNQAMLEKTELIEVIQSMYDGQSAIDYLQLCCSSQADAQTNCPELILLDLDMPVVNGFDVLDTLQQSQNTAWLISDRIIVLTTTINPMDMERASAYGIYDFLVKPLTETKIKGVLEQFLNRHADESLSGAKQESSRQPATEEKHEPSESIAAPNATTKESSNEEL